jgi:DNA repair protein RadC
MKVCLNPRCLSIINETVVTQILPTLSRSDEEDQAIAQALAILQSRLRTRPVLSNLDTVKSFLRLQSQGLTHEVFAVMYLDSQHQLIEYERLFRGTLTHTSVYPREVVKQALAKNAASVILHHNHPSGTCRPSRADEALTQCLANALRLVDVRVLDHVITSAEGVFSMAQEQMLF